MVSLLATLKFYHISSISYKFYYNRTCSILTYSRERGNIVIVSIYKFMHSRYKKRTVTNKKHALPLGPRTPGDS